jgi:hypothetical protein
MAEVAVVMFGELGWAVDSIVIARVVKKGTGKNTIRVRGGNNSNDYWTHWHTYCY